MAHLPFPPCFLRPLWGGYKKKKGNRTSVLYFEFNSMHTQPDRDNDFYSEMHVWRCDALMKPIWSKGSEVLWRNDIKKSQTNDCALRVRQSKSWMIKGSQEQDEYENRISYFHVGCTLRWALPPTRVGTRASPRYMTVPYEWAVLQPLMLWPVYREPAALEESDLKTSKRLVRLSSRDYIEWSWNVRLLKVPYY